MKTKHKVIIAKLIFKILSFFRLSNNQIVYRNKIKWKLDLSEGIDLSVFLFGNFERELIEMINKLSDKENFDILDIGANIGVHTLQFAKEYPESKIYSIEPTQFAYYKLCENIDLNPNLKNNILKFQTFISDKNLPEEIYSSWSLKNDKDAHEHHRGILKKTTGTNIFRLDDFIEKNNVNKNLIIKCDVDGYELNVFKSGYNFLSKYKPNIIMEFAPYLYKEKGYSQEELVNFFIELNYKFFESKSFMEIENISSYIMSLKKGSSVNVFLK